MFKKIISLVICFALVSAQAADNDAAGPKFQAGSSNQVQLKTTDTGGVHVPHVIVDSGGGSGGGAASDTAPATQAITAADAVSATATGQNGQNIITGTPTAGSAASFALSSLETVDVQITGTWVGTLMSEVSMDSGTTWATRGMHLSGTVTSATSFTSNAIGTLNVAGKTNFRIRCTAYTSGTATIRITGSSNDSTVYVANAMKLVDGVTSGSTTQASIKPASTAAAATDTSLVFQLNPAQPNLTTPLNVSATALPSSIGTKTMAGSTSVTLASDLPALQAYNPDANSGAVSITTQNLNPLTGVATAGSTSGVTALNGATTARVNVTGTYTGALTLQTTTDLVNWTSVGFVTNASTNVQTATITSAAVGEWTANVAGAKQVRVSAQAAVTGTAVVTVNVTSSAKEMTVLGPLPAGTNIIGALSANQSSNVAQINGVAPSMGSGTNGTGVLRTSLATDQAALSVAGVFSVKLDQTTDGTTNKVSPIGKDAHSAATSVNPVPTSGRVVPITAATVDATLTAGDAGWVPLTTSNQSIQKPFGTAELDWNTLASFTPTTWASAATPTTLRAASGTANIRTYITSLQIEADALGAALIAWVLDGAVSVSSVTIATPGVFTNSGTNDFKAGDAVIFENLGTITGISANTIYYVTSTSLATTTFTVALTVGGTALQITGSTSTPTVYRVLQQVRLQTAAVTPVSIPLPTPIRTAPNVALSVISSSTQTGAIYVSGQGYYGF